MDIIKFNLIQKIIVSRYDFLPHQYMTARNGEVMGVTLSRAALITNTKAVSQACGYDRGKIIVSLVDPKREVGLVFPFFSPAILKLALYLVLVSLSKTLQSIFSYLFIEPTYKFSLQVGLAMSVLGPVYSGANTIFIPPLLSRNHPAAWLQVITKHKG